MVYRLCHSSQLRFKTSFPAVSPDGEFLAFVSTRSGDNEVYVRPIHREGGGLQVSNAGGTEPAWGPDGRTLFYRFERPDGTVLVEAKLDLSSNPSVESREILFSVEETMAANPHRNYDISPDGNSFVFVQAKPVYANSGFARFVGIDGALIGREGREGERANRWGGRSGPAGRFA